MAVGIARRWLAGTLAAMDPTLAQMTRAMIESCLPEERAKHAAAARYASDPAYALAGRLRRLAAPPPPSVAQVRLAWTRSRGAVAELVRDRAGNEGEFRRVRNLDPGPVAGATAAALAAGLQWDEDIRPALVRALQTVDAAVADTHAGSMNVQNPGGYVMKLFRDELTETRARRCLLLRGHVAGKAASRPQCWAEAVAEKAMVPIPAPQRAPAPPAAEENIESDPHDRTKGRAALGELLAMLRN